jgi:nucleoid-associated protein YgaU
MTDRGLPIVDGAPACPFVAFEDDRDGRGFAPDHRHRCFAEPRPAPRALAHQEAYCLSSAFPVCPTFQDWARREAALARSETVEAPQPTREEPPVSQSLPPPEREPRHASGTDTPPPIPPRRNPPRDWAAPPPWSGDDGEPEFDVDPARGVEPEHDYGPEPDYPPEPGYPREPDQVPVEPPPFLAPREGDRAADAAAYGAASRGLAGSAADRLAGPYGDEPPAAVPPRQSAPAQAPAERDPSPSSPGGRRPTTVSPQQAAPPARHDAQDPNGLFGPAWERPRRYEAYPSLRTRVGLPGLGRPSGLALGAVAVVLAAVVLFFVGPMILGLGGNNGGGGGGATSSPVVQASPSTLPTARPAPTPKIYIVAKGDTMSKIARKFNLTVAQLLAANKQIKNPDRIKAGDQVTIPVPERDSGGASASP